jgi:hypothetical protein
MFRILLVIFALIFSSNTIVCAQDNQNAKEWKFTLGAYIYTPTIGGEVVLTDEAANLLKETNLGGMLNFEAHHPKWFLYTDLMFVNIATDVTVPITNRAGKYDGTAIFWGLYGMRKIAGWLDLGLGVRMVFINSRLFLEEGGILPEINEEFNTWLFPPLIVYQFNFLENEKWLLRLRGDVGGFGFFGTFTYMFEPYAGYQLTNTLQITAGYRYLSLDHENEEKEKITNLYFQGPKLGLLFHF